MIEEIETLVIGCGQAGLAMSHELRNAGVRHFIVDGADGIGYAWRNRYDGLGMITPNWMNSLPGLSYPGGPDAFSDRDDTVRYLEEYAAYVHPPVQWRTKVVDVRRHDGGFLVGALTDPGGERREWIARNVVVATGAYQKPRTPVFASGLGPDVHQTHVHAYRSPDDVPDGPVVVVGSGNSGIDVARQLSPAHEVTVCQGGNARLPRRATGTEVRALLHRMAEQATSVPKGHDLDETDDVLRWLDRLGFWEMDTRTPIGAKLARATSDSSIGPSLAHLTEHEGIRFTGRAVGVSGGTSVVVEGGERLTPRSVVWATGYDSDFSWLGLPVLDALDRPLHRQGVSAEPGLYHLGLRFQTTASSSILYGVGRDATRIARLIARRRHRR
ncbi:flavin-containing monooxygenase [Streptomyces sp. NPDC059761]|uniref:flavin-containing monooxygenase n=1 Tax=Streptomyces sp. NPDC059761 TaxID=3346937 RepID=UPI00366568E9